MMRSALATFLVAAVLGGTAAVAAECPGNPDALGVDRVITVDPAEHSRIGTMQYGETLPLNDKEVVLTFDDGPLPAYGIRVQQALAAECVKATFFLVGRMARAYPEAVRRIYNAGHTIGTHSQNHPLIFTRLSAAAARAEIDQGIASVTAALGDERAVAPFFRFPGLGRSQAIEEYLSSRGIMTWSADFPADDWTHISGAKVMARALERLERKGKGVLLLHDIQPATALMLPQLLRELKRRGYHVVHVVPAGDDRPKTVTEPQSWVMHKPAPQGWPRVVESAEPTPPAPSAESFGWPHPFRIRKAVPIPQLLTGPATEMTASAMQSTPRLPAWSPAPHVSVLAASAEPTLLTAAPTASFSDPAAPSSPGAVPLAESVDGIVAPQPVLAEMIAPPATPAPVLHGKPKPHRPAAKLRMGLAQPRPLQPAAEPTAIRPPLDLSPTAPKLVARTPAPSTP
ncbi:MAG: polysaccharide deacetylase family protein [Xanthobacteraceae bacterium]